MKIGKVIPLQKNDTDTDVNNHRLVPLLSVLSKILEKSFMSEPIIFSINIMFYIVANMVLKKDIIHYML